MTTVQDRAGDSRTELEQPEGVGTPVAQDVRGAFPTYRHKKRGTEYVLLGIGKMQVEHWYDPKGPTVARGNVDMREVAIYRSVDDGSLWVRPREEFEDGRFEATAKAEGRS